MLKINNQPYGDTYFGNNEAIHMDVPLNKQGENVIELKFEDTRDLSNLAMAVEYIREELGKDTPIRLHIPYLPYSGMDRRINNQPYDLKLMGKILNNMNFTAVEVLDPHNEEAMKDCINNLVILDINYFVGQAIDDFKPDVIYFPDKGAMEKYPKTVETRGLPIIHGNKIRDHLNRGRIADYQTITDGVDISDKRVLIIDDICRKGGTFTWAASNLKKLGVSHIALYVSHCEACIFDGNVLAKDSPIDTVYTNDSEPLVIKRMSEKDNEEKASKIKILK